jgi:urease accessory protein
MNPIVFNRVVKAEHTVANTLLRHALELPLSFDERQAVPTQCTASNGSTVHCAIEDPIEIGDRLVSNTNTWAVVCAAPEELLRVPLGQPRLPELMYLAGHHCWPVQLMADAVHLIASLECQEQLKALGLHFDTLNAPLHELALPTHAHEHEHDDHDHSQCGHHHGHDQHDHSHGQCNHPHHHDAPKP